MIMDDEMSRAALKVAFDGPAIHDGSMDVRDLAPALLAIGKLCEEANRVLNGDRVAAKVLVRSDFKTGSFEVNLDLVQSLMDQLRGLLISDDATAAANLLAFLSAGMSGIGAAGYGLFKLIKWLRGRQVRDAVALEDGNVRIVVDGGESLEIPRPVFDLFRDLSVRRALADAIRPLDRPGVDTIRFAPAGQADETITKADAPYFVAPIPPEETLIEEERRVAYSISSMSFQDGNKWRLHDGQNSQLVAIADQDFLNRVNANDEVFAKGDILVCRVLFRQTRVGEGLKSEYTVLEVLQHQSAARQLNLPLGESRPKNR